MKKKEIIYPQITLTPQATTYFDNAIDLSDATLATKLIHDSFKNKYYINFLNFLRAESAKSDALIYKELIESYINQCKCNKVREKWIWLAQYFNQYVLQFHSIAEIKIS